MITLIINWVLALLYFLVAFGHYESKVKWTAFVLGLLMLVAGLGL